VPNSKQAQYPAPKQTIREKPRWSAPPRYQQTITQMNPFRAIYHPESEDEALQTDEDEEQSYYNEEEEPNYIVSPVGRKRRRITPVKAAEPKEISTRKMMTRSSARKSANTEPQLQVKDEDVESPGTLRFYKPPNLHPTAAATLMPPPVTPRTWRKREIPSSQSPADSPLSTQSRRSARSHSRSPLKDRSANLDLPVTSTRQGVLWPRKLEVEDSMENKEEDSPICTRIGPSTEPLLPTGEPEDLVENDRPHSSTIEMDPGWRSSGEVLDSSQQRDSEASRSTRTEAARYSNDIFDSDCVYDGENTETESIDLVQGPVPGETDMGGQTSKHDTCDSTPNSTEGRRTSANPPALLNSSKDGIITPHKERSESEELSAQLSDDLQRATQPVGGLQTDSQYENAWHPYNPADTPIDTLDDNNNAPTPSPPPLSASESHSMPAPLTIPTQILPQTPTPFPFKHPVPPSQATTEDITQPSPRKMPSMSSLAFPSSPPPMPPSRSSPLESGKVADMWVGFEWNRVRLTDSQLLPESLMNDSYFGPPGGLELDLSQEGVEE